MQVELNGTTEDIHIERRSDGTLIVRVHSVDDAGNALPDAVFTFRPKDPQYEIWERWFQQSLAEGK